TGGSSIFTDTLDTQRRGNLTVNASDVVELSGGNPLGVGTTSAGVAGDLTITTRRLIVKDGAQVSVDNSNSESDSVPQLTVNASDSVELSGGSSSDNIFIPSGLFSATYGVGNAGNITINTRSLSIQGGAGVSTKSSGFLENGVFLPATGKGGNLTVNASKSIELSGTLLNANGSNPSSLSASTKTSGSAGDLNLSTGQLIISDGAVVTVSSQYPKDVTYTQGTINLGQAGNLNVSAGSILLNEGKLTSNSESGKGGNITLNVQDLLLMRRNSQISTNAETPLSNGDGGNININSKFLVAVPNENSDISANAFTGIGGRVDITTDGLFGIVPQKSPTDPTEKSDITASSQLGVSGEVTIKTLDTDPSHGLIQLPSKVVDASQQITQGCTSRRGKNTSHFIATGRGGLPQSPNEPLRGQAVITGWVDLPPQATERVMDKLSVEIPDKKPIVSITKSTNQIVEAQGWIVDANGDIILVAQSGQSSSIKTAVSCNQ
ncbi:MAG: autotransporter outer membrane beta-barrel domain-containing protein, partial [Nostoc sp.]